MARPLYMLCCLSGAVDKASNQVSHFNIVEQLQLHVPPRSLPDGSIPVPIPLQLQVVSTWVRDDEDAPNDKFEVEVLLDHTGEKTRPIHKSTFQFEESRNHRFTINLAIQPRPDSKSGIYRFEARIRKAGTKRWRRQEYVVPVNVIVPDETAPPKSSGKKKPKSKKR